MLHLRRCCSLSHLLLGKVLRNFALRLLHALLLVFRVKDSCGHRLQRVDNTGLRVDLRRGILRCEQGLLSQLHPLLRFGVRSHRLPWNLNPKLPHRRLHDLFILDWLFLGCCMLLNRLETYLYACYPTFFAMDGTAELLYRRQIIYKLTLSLMN